ncbi:MAG TPA: PQQ-binding-like beta-propeller repeat protein [Planctomycetota bacterium]|nr:PQQ-binding-like beta-propeller repeat protein [Planctomycetota bacterium]
MSAGEAAALAKPLCNWRGDGSGRYPDATPATQWSATKNVRWSATVGKSYSSPIITDRLVLVTAEPNLLICLDRTTGKERWRVETKPSDLADPAAQKVATAYQLPPDGSGMTAATPLTDGVNVYAIFANGIVRAVDLDGKPVWCSFIEAEQSTAYGRSASPILVDGKLIVHMTHLYAFDPASGKRLWVNDDARSTYGSPVGITVAGVALIVTAAGDVARADDGKSVTSRIGTSFNASPIAANDVVYYSDQAGVKAVRMTAALKDQELWSRDLGTDVFGSPLLHDGVLFTITGQGELFAFDAKAPGSSPPLIDARALFEGGGPAAEPLVYASLTLAGHYLFLHTNHGDSVVLEATREAKLVARNKLPTGSGAAPVFSGKNMFVRDGDLLFCIGE